MLTILNGYDPIAESHRFDLILFASSIYSEFPGGLQMLVGNEYPYVNEANIKEPYGDLRRLGTRLTIKRAGNPIVSIIYACSKKGRNIYSLDEEALIHGLRTANNEFRGMRVVAPLIGTSKWDGNIKERDRMITIMDENTKDLNVFIFGEVNNQIITTQKIRRI